MRFALQAGLALRNGQRTLEVVRELEGGSYLLEDVITRRPIEYTRQRLVGDIQAKKLVIIVGEKPLTDGEDSVEPPIVVDLSTLSAKERASLDYRLLYVRALQKGKVSRGQRAKVAVVIAETAAKNGHTRPPSATAVMLWARKYQTACMNVVALIDAHRRRRSPRRLHETVEKTIWKVLKRSYFTTARHTLQFAHDDLKRELKALCKSGEIPAEEAQVPYSTLQRRVKTVDLYQRVASREGVARARIVCRTAFPEGFASYAMQSVQIDHTPLNWVVICDRTGLPLGRPLLTIAICAYSGYIVGFYLSFYGPGMTSVSGVVRNAIQIKDDLVACAGLKNAWLSGGLSDEFVVDNGLEFHSFSFKTMAMTLGVDLTYCRVRTPWLKPQVERFFSTLNTLTLLKGKITKTVANVLRIDPYKDAAITFSDLVKGLMMFVVDVHAQQPNWHKMATPHELLVESLAQIPPVQYPSSLDELKLATGMSKYLTLGKGGIEMMGLPFGCVDFSRVINKHGSGLKLLCKWDPDDIFNLHVLDPDGFTWHTAECRWKHYAKGLSFNQHRLIRDFGRKTLTSPEREKGLLDAKLALHDHWMDATTSRGRADALQAGRYQNMTSSKVLAGDALEPSAPSPLMLVLPLEALPADAPIPTFDSFSYANP
ncbi:DDE-type integrase/transposase/recombinase [Acidovorax sp. Root219]|uniref:integrase catalytic domain-containing protein n=1 Tax=Acidovorax sp. Root219 TaxID=1736493 RepID=UPI000709B3D7|nr:DDE-type integrase/transposase/recombinase [Acidovorax sp. Root219]KRC25601.1 hypothetical protein ASE28_24510 [Acidovorax sp. Root219]